MTPFTLPELQEIARRAFLDAPSRSGKGLSAALDAAVKAVYENSARHSQYNKVIVTFPQGHMPDCHYVAVRTGKPLDEYVHYQTIDGPIFRSKEDRVSDLLSHRGPWREALRRAAEREPSYWTHELEVFDRAFNELEKKT